MPKLECKRNFFNNKHANTNLHHEVVYLMYLLAKMELYFVIG